MQLQSSEQQQQQSSEMLALYRQHECPAEMLLPFRLFPKKANNAFSTYGESKFRASLWNMDSPWIYTIAGFMLFGYFLIAPLSVLVSYHLVHHAALRNVLVALPLVWLCSMPLIYAAIVSTNLSLGYGPKWWHRLLGPTHIGLTDSGFKLYVRGRLFYNYPNLALWTDIFDVDLVSESEFELPTIRFNYQTGFGRKDIYLPLAGLETEEDVQLVLDYLVKYVPVEHQSERLQEFSKVKFKPILELCRQSAGHLAGDNAAVGSAE